MLAGLSICGARAPVAIGFPGGLSGAPQQRPEGTGRVLGAGPVAAAGGAKPNERRLRPRRRGIWGAPPPFRSPRPSPRGRRGRSE